MPNIEIHGLDENSSAVTLTAIETVVKNLEFASDIVITLSLDIVKNLKGKKSPFIRLICTDHDHQSTLRQTLHPLGLDMEIPPLVEFVGGTGEAGM